MFATKHRQPPNATALSSSLQDRLAKCRQKSRGSPKGKCKSSRHIYYAYILHAFSDKIACCVCNRLGASTYLTGGMLADHRPQQAESVPRKAFSRV